MNKLFSDIEGVEKIVEDSSIKDSEGNHEGGEIISKVFKGASGLNDALLFLEEIFSIIEETPELQTNATTGFHINIGTFRFPLLTAHNVPKPDDMDLFKLAVFMGETYLLDIFNRSRNSYAQKVIDRLKSHNDNLENVLAPVGQENVKEDLRSGDRKKVEKLRMGLQTAMMRSSEKYSSVNLTKLSQGYLEFRFAGGSNYHTKIKEIKTSIGRLVFALAVSMDPMLYREEYLKKIYMLFQLKGNPSLPAPLFGLPFGIPDLYKKMINTKQGSQERIEALADFGVHGIYLYFNRDEKEVSEKKKEDAAYEIFNILEPVTSTSDRLKALRLIKTARPGMYPMYPELTEFSRIILSGSPLAKLK